MQTRATSNSGSVCLPLKSPGIADADGVPIIHKTPSVQPSPLRLKQQCIKRRRWIFLKTAGVCKVYLHVSWLRTSFTTNLIGFGATTTSKEPCQLLENKTFNKYTVQNIYKHI